MMILSVVINIYYLLLLILPKQSTNKKILKKSGYFNFFKECGTNKQYFHLIFEDVFTKNMVNVVTYQ